MSTGMDQLRERVANKIMRESKRRRKEAGVTPFLLKMRPGFKLAIVREAKRQNRSITNYILTVLARDMDYKGEI